MESMVGACKDKRGGREEPAGPALSFAFDFGSSSSPPSPPHKLVRTAAFPFRIEPNNSCSVQQAQWFLSSTRDLHPLYKPQGATALPLPLRAGCAFTPSQWQELQRQALIYKHLMSSVPVPADLLLPISARYFPVSGGGGGCYALRLNGAIDPEPGRCRRTDGKKWRCSRDVAPDQKYCERHVHRGRPRSRKPVEIQKPEATASPKAPPSTSGATVLPKGLPAQSPALFTEASKEPRYLDWMKGSSRDQLIPKHQWEVMHSNIEAQLNLSYTNLSSQCSSFHNTDLSSLEERDIGGRGGTPRSFIDAWSTEAPITTTTTNGDKLFSALSGKPPLSNLSLSMRSEIEEGIQMGLGISEYSMGMKPQPLNWMGGPLAEVLGRSGSGTPSPHLIDIMSKSSYGSHEASPRESPTRVSSSPSGVLQKALVSLSDSSSCSSPTFGVAAMKPEVAFQWFK